MMIYLVSEIEGKISKEGVSLNKHAHSKAHGTFENAPGKSNNMQDATSVHLDSEAPTITDKISGSAKGMNGTPDIMQAASSTPNICVASTVISSTARPDKFAGSAQVTSGKTDYKLVAGSVQDAYETHTIISPITTTDEILGPDKGRFTQPAITKNNYEACRKSEKILSKFWADDLDTDQASDNTLEPESNAKRYLPEGDIEEGSLFTPFMSRRQKKSNKKHANKLNDTVVQGISSEHIQTCSKKGVIKSNPKYM